MSAPFNAPTIARRSGITTLPKPSFSVFIQPSKSFFRDSGLESSKLINISENEDIIFPLSAFQAFLIPFSSYSKGAMKK
jgi:hypothetical protein